MHKSNVYFKTIQLWKGLSCFFHWQQLLVHKHTQLILYFLLSWQHINFDCLCDQLFVHNSLQCLWVVNLAKLPIKCFALIMWDIFHSTFRCFVVNGCCIHHNPRPKTIIASLAIWDQMSKRANEKFVIPNLSYRHFVPTHPSHSWFRSGSDWVDVKSGLRHICCLKFCLDFL